MKKLLLSLCAFFICTLNTSAQEAVDLGLSVKWASCNVGANSPEELGTRFILGSTKKLDSECNSTNMVSINKRLNNVTPIHMENYSGNPEYDAATANWGADWRTPTYDEWSELIANCSWQITQSITKDGKEVWICVITGANGNSIYLPMIKISPGNQKIGLFQCATPTYKKNKIYCMAFNHKRTELVMAKPMGQIFFIQTRPVTDK